MILMLDAPLGTHRGAEGIVAWDRVRPARQSRVILQFPTIWFSSLKYFGPVQDEVGEERGVQRRGLRHDCHRVIASLGE